jgi:hypothetical protein
MSGPEVFAGFDLSQKDCVTLSTSRPLTPSEIESLRDLRIGTGDVEIVEANRFRFPMDDAGDAS